MKNHIFQVRGDDLLYNEFLKTRDELGLDNDPTVLRSSLLAGFIWCRRMKAAGMWNCQHFKIKKMIDGLSPEETRYMLEELREKLNTQ